MRQSTRTHVQYGALAIGAILIAAPGVHLFELWLDHMVAFWLSHALAVGSLGVVAWRWRVARAEAPPPGGSPA